MSRTETTNTSRAVWSWIDAGGHNWPVVHLTVRWGRALMANIEKTYHFDAPRSAVYNAWVSSNSVVHPAVKLHVDARVGGKYILTSQFGEHTSIMSGRFEKVIPHKCLIYTREWDEDGEVSRVEVDFCDAGAGTRVELRHKGLSDPETFENHNQGWDSYVAGLVDYLPTSR